MVLALLLARVAALLPVLAVAQVLALLLALAAAPRRVLADLWQKKKKRKGERKKKKRKTKRKIKREVACTCGTRARGRP